MHRHQAVRAVTALALTLFAIAGVAAPADAAPPPLLDRELFFGDPDISGAQISPDGRWISFRKPYKEVVNIWVKKAGEPFDAARPITADLNRPVRIYFWSEDSRYVLYVQDKGGDEDFHVYAVDPAGKPGPGGVPVSRDLTPIEGIRAAIYAVPEADPDKIIIGLNDRDPALHDVYRLDIETGERELLITNDTGVARWATDLDGDVRLAVRQTLDGGTEILPVVNGELGEPIYGCTFEESCGPIRFHKDGERVYIVSNKGDVDLTRLMLMDARTGLTELVEADPEGDVDFGSPIFSDATEELIGTVYIGDRERIYPRTKALEKDIAFLRKTLPDGELGIAGATEDESRWIVAVSRDVNPGEVYLYDRAGARVEKLYDSRPELPSEHLAPMQAVRYTARDGVEIPAYLTIPKGAEPRNLPVVIVPHGGPWSRDTWGYSSFPQFLANRGYAVLQPNFRGSTGYGKAFLNAGNNEWGTGIMQHDITDAVKYLVNEGIADPERIAIMGGSYGGYATLAGLTFTPEVYAAGVSIVGPSNIITLLNSIPPYWGPIKKMFTRRVGDPDVPADRKRLEAQSPFYHARAITAPLLVIQGANDPRVKKAESDQIVVALRDLDRDIEYMVAPDEGHGFAGEENRLAMMAVIEKFLAEHLGGRYQAGASSEVAERIESLQVDVDTVTMPEVPDASAAAADMVKIEPNPELLEPIATAGVTEVNLGTGRQMTIEVTRELSRSDFGGRPTWLVTTEGQTPMGAIGDRFHIDARTLRPVHREVTRGPAIVELSYNVDQIDVMIRAMGQEQEMQVPLDDDVYGNEAAIEAVLWSLPLGVGYRTSFKTFDMQTQSVRTWTFEVTGSERRETAESGSFDCFVGKITSVDGGGGDGTLWISKEEPRVTVRAEFALPPMAGGGTSVYQLVKIRE